MMSHFDNVQFADSKLDNALCSGSQFYSCRFHLNDLIEMNFIGCLVDETEFKTNRLDNCRFATAILRNTTFDNCKLIKPVMREVHMVSTRFVRSNVTTPMLQRAVLIHTNLNVKKLANADTEGLVVI